MSFNFYNFNDFLEYSKIDEKINKQKGWREEQQQESMRKLEKREG